MSSNGDQDGVVKKTIPEPLVPNAVLRKKHKGAVNKLVVGGANNNVLVSASSDKTLYKWELMLDETDCCMGAYLKKSLVGHAHHITDVALSQDGKFALSASSDSTLRLWDLNSGICTRKFAGHTKDATCVAFSNDNRLIVSGSQDKTIKLWNTIGNCKETFSGDEGHQHWVSKIIFSHFKDKDVFLTAGWDCKVKVFDFELNSLLFEFVGAQSPIVSIATSPDHALLAVAGKNGEIKFFNMATLDQYPDSELFSLASTESAFDVAFCPNHLLLAVAHETSVAIWELNKKEKIQTMSIEFSADEVETDAEVEENEDQAKNVSQKHTLNPKLLKIPSLCWDPVGQNLYVGFSNGSIRIWTMSEEFLDWEEEELNKKP